MSGQDIKGFLSRHRGKIGGVFLGLLLRIGFFGPLLGLTLGFFWDEFLGEKRILQAARSFLAEPSPQTLQKIPPGERPGFLLMILGRRYFLALKAGGDGWNSLEIPYTRALRNCLEPTRDIQRGIDRAAALFLQPPPQLETVSEMVKPLIKEEEKRKVAEVLFSLSPGGDRTAESRRFLHSLCRCWNIPLPREENPHMEYHLLGLPPDAPMEQVKQTFRTLAAQFHPDTAVHLTETQKNESEEAFRKIRNAYEKIIKDKSERG